MDLVIGIGNSLRSDDGIGPHLVERLVGRDEMEAVAVQQLTLDLADRVRRARRVLFVDADAIGEEIRLRRLSAKPGSGLGHSVHPAALLDWTQRTYGTSPEAWLLSVPGERFEIGEGLSWEAEQRLPAAVDAINGWLEQTRGPMTCSASEEET